MLLGYPVVIAGDMPDAGAGLYPIAFGDFGQGYAVVDNKQMTVLRDPFSAKPFVLFYTYSRVGGGVLDFDAIRIAVWRRFNHAGECDAGTTFRGPHEAHSVDLIPRLTTSCPPRAVVRGTSRSTQGIYSALRSCSRRVRSAPSGTRCPAPSACIPKTTNSLVPIRYPEEHLIPFDGKQWCPFHLPLKSEAEESDKASRDA